MRPFQSQQYEALPVEEKAEDSVVPKTSVPWGKILISVFISFLTLSALTVIVGNRGLVQNQTLADTVKHDDATDKVAQEEAEAYLSRATGQQYLLGVGKADITG
jgi:hypothetical protein